MTQLQQKLMLPEAMAEKLEVVRRRTLRVGLGTAIVTALGILLAAMAAAMLIDGLATLYDFRWRAALTYSAWAAAGITLLAWTATVWQLTRRTDRVATKVDREIPSLEERWSTVTTLAAETSPTNGQSTDVHPAMFRQVSTEAQSWTSRVEADRVVPIDGLIRALLLLTAITSVLGIAVLFDSHRTAILLQRFWQPFTAISATELTDLSGDLVVGRGESLVIEANLLGRPVEKASLLLQPIARKSEAGKSHKGKSKTITLTPRGESQDQLTYRLRAVKEPLRYRLRAGDGQTRWYEIIVADRPQLANVRLQLTPPDYVRKPPQNFNQLPRRVTALEGTRVKIALKPKQAVQNLQLKLGDDSLLQLTADQEGWYHWETTLTKDIAFQPLLTEQHGLGNLRPPTCEIKCRPDRPPVVKILTPNNQMAVRPNETIPITFIARDDVGIQFAELMVYDESQKVDGKPKLLETISVPLGDQQGAEEVKATVQLDLSKYTMTEGSELSFSIRVREDRGQERLASNPNNQVFEATPLAQELSAAKSRNKNREAPRNNSATKSAVAQQTASDSKEKKPVQEVADESALGSAPATESAEQLEETEKASNSFAKNKTPSAPKATTPAISPETPEKSHETTTSRQSLDAANPNDSQALNNLAEDNLSEDTLGEDQPTKPTVSSSDPQTLSENSSSASTANNLSKDGRAQQSSGTPDQQGTNTSAKSGGGSQPSTPSNNSPAPDNPMPKRSLDVEQAQSSSSQRMQLKIDQWAGSYDGQQRQMLELAIAPQMEQIDRALEKAQLLSRLVLDDVDVPNINNASEAWISRHDRDIRRADEQVEAATKIVEDIKRKTYDTPYAFIGLQLSDIGQAHIDPARRDFWKSLQTEDLIRIQSIRNGWQHTTRARELLMLLTQRFDRTKTEYKMADSVEHIKKMYRVFVEDSMALLRSEDDEGSRYNRKIAEFDLDEEYLKRLGEVLDMRSEMRAELARILADDPRLLRRYLDAQRNRQIILRNDLDRLIERQSELNRETRAWAMVEEEMRPKLAMLLLRRHIESAQDLARTAADLHDRFETWSPLGEEIKDADFQAATQVLQEIATATQELSADGLRFVADTSRVKKHDEALESTELKPSEGEDKRAENPVDSIEAVEQISNNAQQLYQHFTQLEILLRRIGNRQDRADIAYFATNRLLENRRLIEQTSAWIRQLKQQQAGNYPRSAEVAQYRLAMETDAIAGKLSDLEQRMAGLFQNEDGMLPLNIAEKARGLLAILDEQAAPNQLAAVSALRRNQMSRATTRQESAVKALELAGELYDEMIEASIKELDKLPVEDPIASLLNDPTLDELLRGLEQELPIEEILGIPRRPSNLQIVSDWLRPGGNNAMATGSNRQELMNRMNQQQEIRQRQLELAYRRAVARALREAEAKDLVRKMPQRARETDDWNSLVSQLDDDLRQGRDKAPPERYRRAIEQYFRQVSGAEKKRGN